MDRDFRCSEEVAELVSVGKSRVQNFRILGAKEIENYLLAPHAIAKAAQQKLKERKSGEEVRIEKICELIQEIVLEQKTDVLSQYISNRVRFFTTRSAKDASTVVKEAMENFDSDWNNVDRRIMISPGKKIFAALNGRLQTLFGISITSAQVIKHLTSDDAGAEFLGAINDINLMAKAS